MLHVRQLVAHSRQQRRDRRIDNDHLIVGVIDDELQLLGKQPNVERVQYRAHTRDREVGLHMGLVVPHERADAIALLDT